MTNGVIQEMVYLKKQTLMKSRHMSLKGLNPKGYSGVKNIVSAEMIQGKPAGNGIAMNMNHVTAGVDVASIILLYYILRVKK